MTPQPHPRQSSVAPKLTVRDLYKRIMEVHPDDWDQGLRVVFHGYESPSWNRRVSAIQEGPNFDLQFLVEDPNRG